MCSWEEQAQSLTEAEALDFEGRLHGVPIAFIGALRCERVRVYWRIIPTQWDRFGTQGVGLEVKKSTFTVEKECMPAW